MAEQMRFSRQSNRADEYRRSNYSLRSRSPTAFRVEYNKTDRFLPNPSLMNDDHLEIIKRGVDHWNQWRRDNPDIKPDLSGRSLFQASLHGANLTHTNL